jgi:hypothetical protein
MRFGTVMFDERGSAARGKSFKYKSGCIFLAARDPVTAMRHWIKWNGCRLWIQRITCNVVWRLCRGRERRGGGRRRRGPNDCPTRLSRLR